jgi:selenocysteine lyase/cysteine desulfurase
MEPDNAIATGRPFAEPGYDLNRWRTEIPLLESFTPLNACSHSPQTRQTRAAADRYLDDWNRNGMDWGGWMEEVENARAAFASLINASVDEIAITTSVSAATTSVASALDFSGSRNEIVISGAEFPSVAHVWLAQQRNGATVKWAQAGDEIIGAEVYENVVSDRTVIVSACHSWYLNGFKQDLEAVSRIARRHGAMIFVDAYQSLGTCPVDVQNMDIDFLSGGALKYLMGVPGIAFLYVRRSLLEQLKPTVTGWFGRKNPFAFTPRTLDWSETARRFDTGTPPVPSAFIARAGLDVIGEVGLENIDSWTRLLSSRLIERAEKAGMSVHGSTDPARKTPSTAIVSPVPAHEVETELRSNGILASARGPVIRLAPHFYNTLDEMDVAIDALQHIFDRSKR